MKRLAREVCLGSAARDFGARRSATRDVTTSVELMDVIARLAGWTTLRWYPGDEPNIRAAGTGETHALGQSAAVLQAETTSPPAG